MNNKVYFKNLDGIRTIAALMVFFWHAYGIAVLKIPDGILKSFLLSVFNGDMGVCIFFVLSGFLITYLILNEIKENSKLSLGHFYLRRVLRIWPLYFGLLVVAYFILLPILSAKSNINSSDIMTHSKYYFLFVSNFDMIQSAGEGSYLPVGITWSVAVEEQFYLFWPLLFFFLPVKTYKYVLLLTVGASIIFKIWHYDDIEVLRFHSISAMTNLSIGGIAAYYAVNNKIRQQNFFFKNNTAIYLTGALLIFADNYFDFPGRVVIFKTLEALFFAFVILDQSFNAEGKFKISRSGWLTKWGKYTYGIYMLHMTVLYGVSIACIVFHLSDLYKHILSFVVALPLTLLIAYLSYEFYEKRFLALKDKIGYRK